MINLLVIVIMFIGGLTLYKFISEKRYVGTVIPTGKAEIKHGYGISYVEAAVLDKYIAKFPYVYMLDVRGENEWRIITVKDVNNIIMLFYDMKEPGFVENVVNDSRFRSMLESTKELLIICDNGTRSRRVCEHFTGLKKDFDFTPVFVNLGIDKLPHNLLRFNVHGMDFGHRY